MGKGKGKSSRGRGGEETRAAREVYQDYGSNRPPARSSDARTEDEEEEEGEEIFSPSDFPVGLFMWEFGQNDPKR
jgi:hypothetical protein